MEVGVPSGYALFEVSRVVQDWIDANGLEHNHRGVAPDDAKEDVVRLGPVKGDLKPPAQVARWGRRSVSQAARVRRATGARTFSP